MVQALAARSNMDPPEGLGDTSLLLTSCVNLGDFLYLFEPQFCHF